MSQYKILQPKQGVTLLAVKQPEGEWEYQTIAEGILWFVHNKDGRYFKVRLPFECELLGIATEIPEEVWQGIVPSVYDFLDGFGAIMQYPDFTDETRCYITATESAMSFLEANEVDQNSVLLLKI